MAPDAADEASVWRMQGSVRVGKCIWVVSEKHCLIWCRLVRKVGFHCKTQSFFIKVNNGAALLANQGIM